MSYWTSTSSLMHFKQKKQVTLQNMDTFKHKEHTRIHQVNELLDLNQ
jgi:hypothetical protein